MLKYVHKIESFLRKRFKRNKIIKERKIVTKATTLVAKVTKYRIEIIKNK